jgi:tRNA1Val (adenine37-N6)-methyltransferase
MANNYFQFKQFTVWQDHCAMKVGTDAVLLGSWADVSGTRSILDVGTGTGIIALMMAQRSKARVDAVEIDSGSARQAMQNFNNSPWADRIFLFQQPFQEYASRDHMHDLIVCNPPFFSNALGSPDPKRSRSRHDNELELEELFQVSASHLNTRGKLCVILPIDKKAEALKRALVNGLIPYRELHVKGTPRAKVKRVLLEFGDQERALHQETLVIEEERHVYTPEFIELTKDFYLSFH